MSIKRSIVIGQPKETQGAAEEEKKTSKKTVASVKKGSLERTAPVGIVHDKTVLKIGDTASPTKTTSLQTRW